MSKAAWATFASSCLITASLITFVHYDQKAQRAAMRTKLNEDPERVERKKQNQLEYEQQLELKTKLESQYNESSIIKNDKQVYRGSPGEGGMLSSNTSFDPIFDVDYLPIAALSLAGTRENTRLSEFLIAVLCVENKIVRKAIGMAKLLSGKSRFLSAESHQGRQRLLLMSMMKISYALHETNKIFRDDRAIEIVEVLAHFSLDYLGQLEWIDIEAHLQKVKHAKKLIAIFAWRKKTRGEAPICIIKLFQRIEPFIHAIEKRRAFNNAVEQMEVVKAKNLFFKWKAAIANKKMAKFQKALVYSRWKQLSSQTMAASRINGNYLATKYLGIWRQKVNELCKDEHLASRLLYAQGVDPRFIAQGNSQAMIKSASEMGLKARVFSEWRKATRLNCFSNAKNKDQKYILFSQWSKRTTDFLWSNKTAEFHDKVRRLRPIFETMKLTCQKYNEASQYLASHSRLKKCYEVLGKWKKAVKTISLKRRYFDTFTRKARFLLSAEDHATKLSEVTTKLCCLALWKGKYFRRHAYNAYLENRGSVIRRRDQKQIFAIWKAKAVNFKKNSDMVEAWRATEDKREVFNAWKNKAIVEHNCKTFYLRGIFRSAMSSWKDALKMRNEAKHLSWRIFTGWRRYSKEVQSTRFFAGSALTKNNIRPNSVVPSNVLIRVRCILNAGQASQVSLMAKYFKTWYNSVSNVNALEKTLKAYETTKMRVLLQRLRLVFRYHELSENQPKQELEKAWRHFKQGYKRSIQRRLVLDLRLNEHFGSQEFMLHFRYFKIWERAFQVAKMEEHLCEQNLMAYEHQKKRSIIKAWKLMTGQRMFQQYSNLVNRRKIALGLWRFHAKLVVEERNRRILFRAVDTWRDALMTSRMSPLFSQLDFRRKSRAFGKWKKFGGSKYDLKFNKKGTKIVTPWFVQSPPPPRFDDMTVRKAKMPLPAPTPFKI